MHTDTAQPQYTAAQVSQAVTAARLNFPTLSLGAAVALTLGADSVRAYKALAEALVPAHADLGARARQVLDMVRTMRAECKAARK